MTGHWPSFPSDPAPFYEELLEEIEDRDFYTWRSTGGLARRMSDILESLAGANADDPAALLACHRAALNALVHAYGRADDSGGYLGGFADEAVPAYLTLPWRDTGIDPATYYRDFIEFAVWEDCAVTWEKTDRFFRRIPNRESELVEGIVREVVDELRGHRFMDYRTDEALDLLAELYVFKKMLDRFLPAAAEMGSRKGDGSRSWRRRPSRPVEGISDSPSSPRPTSPGSTAIIFGSDASSCWASLLRNELSTPCPNRERQGHPR